MSDPWEEAETDIPEFMKDPDYYKQVYDELCPAAQRGLHAVGQRIIDFFREHGMINEGTELYVDEYAIVAAVGMKPITREALSKQTPKYMWGRGSEAFIASYVIDQRPAMKHEAWTAARKVLSKIPAHPSQAPIVIALLNSTIAKERQCWVQVATLRSAHTLQSIAALDMDAILVSMCSLAGITFQGGDPIDAVEKAYYDLSDDMAMLRRYH
ncbi:hypothetical protein TrVFT333_004735 [Trichoderma virens FT-333]|nr:hypothetical protein TrVFT333_004735 [Trichoderma virens FT-333]